MATITSITRHTQKDRTSPYQLADLVLFLGLFFAPLAVGSVYPWTVAVIALLALAAFLLFFLPMQPRQLLQVPGKVWIMAFLAVVLFQMLPMSPHLLKMISPGSFAVYKDYLFDYSWSSQDLRTVSIYPYATRFDLIKLIAYSLVFCVITRRVMSPKNMKTMFRQIPRYHRHLYLGLCISILSILLHSLCDFNLHIPSNALYFTVLLGLIFGVQQADKKMQRSGKEEVAFDADFVMRLVNVIIVIGFFIAVFALVQRVTSTDRIYWIFKSARCLYGPFVSYNHFAGFMELCIPLSIASFLACCSGYFSSENLSFRQKIEWILSPHGSKALLYLFSSIIMTSSLFFSLSRGGIMSFMAAMLVYGSILAVVSKKSKRIRMLMLFFLLLLLIFVMIVWIGPEVILARLQTIREVLHEPILNITRPRMWLDSLEIIKDYPLFGSGLGTFQHIYPKYRTIDWTMKFARYPENDYVQMVVEMGLVGALFIVVFLFFYMRGFTRCVKRLWQ